MTDHAHDVSLPSVVIDGVAHGLAVDSQTFIGLPVVGIPALQCALERAGIDSSGVTSIEAGGRTTEVRADQTAFIANRQGAMAFIPKPAGMPGDDGQRPEDLRINLEQTFGTASSTGRGEPGFYTFVTEGSIGVREGGASELVVQAGEGSFTGAGGGLPRRTLPPAFLATDRFLSGTAGGGQVCMAQ